MFDYEKWQEIFNTIRKNKLRTILTMFGVFWGIFMLMLLMGSGNGLENGVKDMFSGWATNSGFVWGERTTMPYKGLKPGRGIQFRNDDIQYLRAHVEGLEHLAPRLNLHSWDTGNKITRKSKAGSFRVNGDYPEYQKIQMVDVVLGRHINSLDLDERRKVCVIGKTAREILFQPEEDPIGDYISINGIFFKVVGVFHSKRTGGQADFDNQTIYTPYTSFQQAFNYGDRVGWFGFTALPGYKVSEVESNIKTALMERHNIHPEDYNAVGSENLEKEYSDIEGLFNGIDIFVWIVAIGTLMAGVIGVSNIMLIIVKERTKEIGIRKSLGATPLSIIGLIMQESIFITAIAGYVGLVLGNFILIGIANAIASTGEKGMFQNPEIDMGIAIKCLLILLVSGAFAGWIPARKAASVNPIEALRAE